MSALYLDLYYHNKISAGHEIARNLISANARAKGTRGRFHDSKSNKSFSPILDRVSAFSAGLECWNGVLEWNHWNTALEWACDHFWMIKLH